MSEERAFAPHCDASVLHAPGDCEFCDHYPDWQAQREVWRINYTGKNDPDKAPCPSTYFRPLETIERWPGNRPSPVEAKPVIPVTVAPLTPGLTDDPSAPHAQGPPDEAPTAQADKYLVLSEEERRRGFVRPVRESYWHTTCGSVTTMNRAIAETYAADPKFYGGTFCVRCSKHRPVSEFRWVAPDGTRTDIVVGS